MIHVQTLLRGQKWPDGGSPWCGPATGCTPCGSPHHTGCVTRTSELGRRALPWAGFVRPQALPPVPQLLWRPAVTGLFLNREVTEAVPLGWLLGGGPGEGSVAIPTQVFVPPGGTDTKSEGPK